MQRVIMVRPDWEKGFIDKFLVCDLSLKKVEQIFPFDVDNLSHTQYAAPWKPFNKNTSLSDE